MRSLAEIQAAQPNATYVAVFQNWLRPAGASFDHLHKQLVAIDEQGPQVDHELRLLSHDHDLYQREIADLAGGGERLVVAANDGAVAFAGVGHRYPAFEVFSTSPANLPQEHSDAGIRAVSDLVHALHAATGVHVPTNEEWHYRPPGAPWPMPWRVVLKPRVSNPAGFEGGTKIYVNTIDPWNWRRRAVDELERLRDAGALAPWHSYRRRVHPRRRAPAIRGAHRNSRPVNAGSFPFEALRRHRRPRTRGVGCRRSPDPRRVRRRPRRVPATESWS